MSKVKLFFIVSILLLSLTAITACGNAENNSHSHTWNKWIKDDEYTHTRTCSCGESETNNHKWDNGVKIKTATCKNEGVKMFTCVDCGQTKTETIEITDHTWSDWVSDNDELHSRICSVCDKQMTASHTFQDYVCVDCDYQYEPAVIKSVDSADVDFSTSTVKMLVDKYTHTINLSNAVNVSLGSSWKLYTSNNNLIATKIVNLNDGNNTFLIVVTSSDGLFDNTYALSIYKSFEITIDFYGVYDNLIKTETADTGYEYSVTYSPQITGYTFDHWELNNEKTTKFIPFENTRLYADCSANEYEFVFDVNGGDNLTNNKQSVTFDKSYILPTPIRAGYTLLGWYYGEMQITDYNGASLENSKFATDIEVTAHWKANTYTITAQSDNSRGTISGSGLHDCDSFVTLTAIANLGYVFIGWYENDTFINSDEQYTFTMPANNVIYTAKWDIKSEMQVFEFTSNQTTCRIGGVKDNSITKLVIPDCVTHIENNAFNGCYEVTTIEIGKGVIFLNSDAFSDCYNLSELTVNRANKRFRSNNNCIYQVNNYPNYTSEIVLVRGCKTSVIPDDITRIGQNAFLGCSSLINIFIPNSVTIIDPCAFQDCCNLTGIVIPKKVTSIGERAFGGCSSLASITLPFAGTIAGESGNTYIESFGYIFGQVPYPGSNKICQKGFKNGIGGTLVYYYIPTSLKDVTITGDNIVDYAFYNCDSLSNIVLSSSTVRIGDYAFSYCNNLINIEIPYSVNDIGAHAFIGCTNLTICCRANKKPDGWNTSWNSDDCPVIWDYKS